MRIQVSFRTVLRGAALGLAALSLAACATAPTPSSRMQLAGMVIAPSGMADFCARSPEQCASSSARLMAAAAPNPRVDGQKLERVALGRTSAGSFGGSFGSLAAAPVQASATTPSVAAFMPASSRVRADNRRNADWGSLFAAARAESAPAARSDYRSQGFAADVLQLTPEHWKLVSSVNNTVNSRLVYRKDVVNVGMEDQWSLPLLSGQKYGDCEDFVLEKRRKLIEAGVPASALTIALVVTRTGESHAVLVVGTDKGDYVMDNLTPWVVPWSEASYHWVARQVPGLGALDWAAVGPRA